MSEIVLTEVEKQGVELIESALRDVLDGAKHDVRQFATAMAKDSAAAAMIKAAQAQAPLQTAKMN